MQRAQIVAAARELLGTPYRHQGRLVSVALDCAGVLVVVARRFAMVAPGFDITGYGRTPDGTLRGICERYMTPIAQADMQPGDVVLVRWGAEPQHLGIVGDWRHGGLSIIHAENYRHNRVIEHRLWFGDAMQFVAAYRLPGVAA